MYSSPYVIYAYREVDDLKKESVLEDFAPGALFRKEDFRYAVNRVDPVCKESTINWMIHSLRKENRIASAGAGKYYVIPPAQKPKQSYQYPHSQEYLSIEKLIVDNYPQAIFQMWELWQLNEFVNHQIAKNVIFVELETMLLDSVFELLHLTYPYALLTPDIRTFYRQRSPGTDIVVQKLVTEAPAPGNAHSCTLEKLLVDLFTKKIAGSLVEKSEYPRIYEEALEKYRIDETRMFRYARRRHVDGILRQFIKEQTTAKLLTQ